MGREEREGDAEVWSETGVKVERDINWWEGDDIVLRVMGTFLYDLQCQKMVMGLKPRGREVNGTVQSQQTNRVGGMVY